MASPDSTFEFFFLLFALGLLLLEGVLDFFGWMKTGGGRDGGGPPTGTSVLGKGKVVEGGSGRGGGRLPWTISFWGGNVASNMVPLMVDGGFWELYLEGEGRSNGRAKTE